MLKRKYYEGQCNCLQLSSVKQLDGNNKDKHAKREKLLYELKIQKEYLFDNQIEKIQSQIKHFIEQVSKTNDKEKEQIMKIEEKVKNNEKVKKEKEMNEFHAKFRQMIEDAINELKRGQEKSRKIKRTEEDADWYQKLEKKMERQLEKLKMRMKVLIEAQLQQRHSKQRQLTN